MIRPIYTFFAGVFVLLIDFNVDNHVFAIDPEMRLCREMNHKIYQNISGCKYTSSNTHKWFIRAFDDSSETPLFGWTKNTTGGMEMRNFAVVATDKKIYVFDRRLCDWHTVDYSMPNEVFDYGASARDFCLFWTDKNIYVFPCLLDSLIIEPFVDIDEIPLHGYAGENLAMLLTNKRIYICLPDLNSWEVRSYETSNELPYGGTLANQRAMVWTDRGIYISYWYGSLWNVTLYEDSVETPKYGGVGDERAFVATDRRIYVFLLNGPLKPDTYDYEDNSEIPLGGGVHRYFTITWTDKRIYAFCSYIDVDWNVISYNEDGELAKGGGANQSIAYVRTDRNAYVLKGYPFEWHIQEYGTGETYLGGDMTYVLALAWTDRNIYLFDISNPNWNITTFENEEMPEQRGNNSWLSNTALVRTNRNIHVYNQFIGSWCIKSYNRSDEKPLGGDSRNILAMAWTDKTAYMYNALDKTWSVHSFDSGEIPLTGVLGDLSALITTDKKSYAYFQPGVWKGQIFIDEEESPIGGAVSFDFVLSWTDKRMYVCDVEVATSVSLTFFDAQYINGYVELTWHIVPESNYMDFEIQRKSQQDSFQKISFVERHAMRSDSCIYRYIDKDVSYGTYFYRLKQIKTDGSFEYSKIAEIEIKPPGKYVLYQNYPNPFNSTTRIDYQLPMDNAQFPVTLKIYNLLGQEVRTLVDEVKEAGYYMLPWDGLDEQGRQTPSGVYLYRLKTREFMQTRKMILIR